MPIIHWTEKYAVKVTDFDNEHKRLFQLINQLSDSMKAGKNGETVEKIFGELLDYAGSHFKHEIDLMQTAGFPGAMAHKKQHDEFVKKILEMKTNFEAGSTVVTVPLLNFLVSWLNTHILETDKGYGDFLNGKGIH